MATIFRQQIDERFAVHGPERVRAREDYPQIGDNSGEALIAYDDAVELNTSSNAAFGVVHSQRIWS